MVRLGVTLDQETAKTQANVPGLKKIKQIVRIKYTKLTHLKSILIETTVLITQRSRARKNRSRKHLPNFKLMKKQ